LENPVNHKLHLITRADIAAGQLVLEVTGCLTQANYLTVLKRLHQLKRRLGDGTITVDVCGVQHLDPDVLLSLRGRTQPGWPPSPQDCATPAASVRLHLAEPVELPVCLAHVGPDGEVLAQLDGRSGNRRHAGISSGARTPARGRPSRPRTTAVNPGSGPRTATGLSSEIYDGTMDPETTVRALSRAALELLVDALYRHLDSPAPSFGAYTWFELATDELQNRRDEEVRVPSGAAEPAPAGRRARRVVARSRR
jgi:hypothetical protein